MRYDDEPDPPADAADEPTTDGLLELETLLTDAAEKLNEARRIADGLNELPLARDLAKLRDRCRLHRARVVDAITTADRPGRKMQQVA